MLLMSHPLSNNLEQKNLDDLYWISHKPDLAGNFPFSYYKHD